MYTLDIYLQKVIVALYPNYLSHDQEEMMTVREEEEEGEEEEEKEKEEEEEGEMEDVPMTNVVRLCATYVSVIHRDKERNVRYNRMLLERRDF